MHYVFYGHSCMLSFGIMDGLSLLKAPVRRWGFTSPLTRQAMRKVCIEKDF